MTTDKRCCEVQSLVACNGQIVRRLTGPRKSDPKFWCCIGCWAYLSRQGVQLREVKERKARS
jgi:hypothetical protein